MPENNFHVYENESWIGNIWKVFLLCFRMNLGPSTLIRQKPSRQKDFKYCSREGLLASISMNTLLWRSGVPTIQGTKNTSVMIVCNEEQSINLANVHLWQHNCKRYFCSIEGKHEWPFSIRYETSFFVISFSWKISYLISDWLYVFFKGGGYIANGYMIIQRVWLRACYTPCVRHIDT